MPDKKLSLEDILDEYSPEKSEQKSNVATAPRPTSHEKTPWDDNTLRQSMDEPPPKRSGRKITVLNGAVDADGNPKSAVYDNPVINTHMSADDISKIRRMTESTRAREAVEMQKSGNKNRRKKEADYTYKKETPDGEYMYTPPVFKKKKRSRETIIAEAEDPENLKLITDIVPRPAIEEAVKYSGRKPKNTLQKINYDKPQAIDVRIDTEEIKKEAEQTSKKKRTKRIVDFNYYGDVEDVGRDISDLKSIITTRVVILLIVSFFSLYITLMNQLNFPILDILSKNNPRTYIGVHLITGLIAVISSFAVISNGLKKLLSLKADSDSMTSVTAIVCILSLIPALVNPDYIMTERIYMPVGILALLTNALGKQLILKRAERNFKIVSKEQYERHGIVYVHDEERAERLTRGTLGDFPILASMRKTDFLTDFLKYTYSSDITDKYCRKATPICLIISAVISFVITFFCKESLLTLDSLAFGMSIFCMLICATSCTGMPFVANVPLERVSNRSLIKKGVMLGYQSVDDFYDTNSILVNTDSLFPAHSVQLSGVKVFSNTKVNEALLEAASLTTHAGSVMRHLFSDVVDENNDILYHIENFSYEESMGLCGWIHNRRVLFGNRELMHSHNIEGLPTKTKEAEYTGDGQEAMYLSISGNIAALFTVEIRADREVKRWTKQLAKNKIFMILKSVDPCLTLEKIASLFGVSRSMFRILPKKLHEEFDKETKKTVRLSASMACSGKFSSFAQLIIGTKVVHSASVLGLIFQTVSVVLGFILCTLLIISKAFQFNFVYMSATALVIYNLACTLLTYIAVCSKKF
ncbi:MAG: hypothetical protein NC177_07985 [Ruminococcus flavefaciens]|nr:hypothetical protein [Ruminococcus flavefaciens]